MTRPGAVVIAGPGTNRDTDAVLALDLAGAEPTVVLAAELTARPELLDAARIDGAGEFQIFRRIALPLATPVVGLVAFFNFVGNWNNFFLPFITEPDSERKPVQVGLVDLMPAVLHNAHLSFPQFALAILISVVPVLIVSLFSQRFLATGMTAGATKV